MGFLSRNGWRAVAGVILTAGLSAASLGDVGREGTGKHRADLDAMELKPFPAAAWGMLSNWQNGNAVDSASTNGQVVLIFTWKSYYQPSLAALPIAQKVADAHAGKGLIVVGVCAADGWDEAAKAAQSKGAKFPFAQDAKGDFRKALLVDADPDFYLIDRAGQLRYADITTASVEEAVNELVTETAAQAGDVPRILAERDAKAKTDAARTGAIRADIDLDKIPEVPFTKPEPDDYKNLAWPKLTDGQKKLLGLDDENRKPEEVKLTIPSDPNMYWPPAAMDKERPGRLIIAYVWHPDLRYTYDEMMGMMDQLQRQYKRDIVVIGALTPVKSIDRQSERKDDEDAPEKLAIRFAQFVQQRKFEHILVMDSSAVVLGSLQTRSGGGFPVPGVIITSSDGTIRWVGSVHAPDYQAAIDKVMKTDPGVKARRRAEEKYIQSQK